MIRARVLLTVIVPVLATPIGARAATRQTQRRPLPPARETFYAPRLYPARGEARTHRRAWSETLAYVNRPQRVWLAWHLDHGGARAEVWARYAWDAGAPWRRLRAWRTRGRDLKGDETLPVTEPTLLRLRARGPAWPGSGIGSVRADYERATVAVLRGDPGALRRPVVIAEGFDPFDDMEANDPYWYPDDTLVELVEAGRRSDDLDPWVVDWGRGGRRFRCPGG